MFNRYLQYSCNAKEIGFQGELNPAVQFTATNIQELHDFIELCLPHEDASRWRLELQKPSGSWRLLSTATIPVLGESTVLHGSLNVGDWLVFTGGGFLVWTNPCKC